MITYDALADDILSTLGFNHDDATRSREAVLFNIQMSINRLRRLRLEKELATSGDIGSTDSVTTYIVPLFREQFLNDRTYFVSPSSLLDIKQNGGVAYIAYHRESGCQDNLFGLKFEQTSQSEVDILAGNPWTKPREAAPYYFRGRVNVGGTLHTDRVWLVGVSPLIQSVEVGLYMAVDISDPLADPEQPIDLPDDMIYLVKRMVLDLERFALLVPQERLSNDGRDFKVGQQPLQPPQNVSVNDPINLSIE